MICRWLNTLTAIAVLGACTSSSEETAQTPAKAATEESTAGKEGEPELLDEENNTGKPDSPKASTTKTPAPKATPAATKAPAVTGPEIILPVPGNLTPLFAHSGNTPLPAVENLVGQDTLVAEKTDLRPEATRERVQKIIQYQKAAKEALAKKETKAISEALGQSLVFLRQHALYLEYLQGTGQKDPLIKDLPLQYKKVCDQIVRTANVAKRQPGSAAVSHTYDGDRLACLLRTQNSGVLSAAQEFLKKNSATQLGLRIRLIGAAQDLVRGIYNGAFGRLPEILDIPQTSTSRAGLLILSANAAERRGDPKQAQMALLEALRLLGPALQRSGNSPVVLAAAEKLMALSASTKSSDPDSAITNLLATLNAPSLAKAYLEQLALAQAEKKPAEALGRYTQIEPLVAQSPAEKARLVARLIDLAQRAQMMDSLRTHWNTLLRLSETQKIRGLAARADATRVALVAIIQTHSNSENMDGLLSLHDLFRSKIPEYRSNDSAESEILALLVKQRDPALVVQRAEKLASETQKPEAKKQLLVVALRAREKMLGLKETPEWRTGAPKGFSKEGGLLYLKTLESFESSSSSMEEKEFASFQGALVRFLSGDLKEARKRMENALIQFPGSKYASRGAYFFIKNASDSHDYSAMEGLARAAVKALLLPPEKGFPDFKTLAAQSLLEQGRTLASAKNGADALVKYRDCSTEFPDTIKTGDCRLAEAMTLESLGKNSEALQAFDSVLQKKSTPLTQEEARWKVAALSERMGNWTKAAASYENYAKNHPESAGKRKAWFLAGVAYRKATDTTKATDCLSQHLKGASEREEKFRTLKELASLAEERKIPKSAITFHEQSLELVKWLPKAIENDEEIRIRSSLAETHSSLQNLGEAQKQFVKIASLTPRTPEGQALVAKARLRSETRKAP